MSSTVDAAELADRHAITDLRYQYSHTIDACDWERWGSLFTTDAVWNPDGRSPQVGPAEIREFGETVLAEEYVFTCHEAFMPSLDVDGDAAAGEWYLRFTYADRDGIAGTKFGRYRDEYRRTDEGWKFSYIRAEITAYTGSTFTYDEAYDDYYDVDLVRFGLRN
jgi:ketosteroid isomerase-like protein